MLQFLLLAGVAASVGAFFFGAAHALRGLYDHVWQVPGLVLRLTACIARVLIQYAARGRKPRFAEWTLEAELIQGILRCISTHYPHRLVRPANAAYLRHALEATVKKTSQETARAAGVAVQYFVLNGLEHIWLRARDPLPSTGDRCVVLYLHGGGFVVGCPGTYIAMAGALQRRIRALLAQQLGRDDVKVEFLLANYRKAPQFPYPVPPQDAYAMYKYLLEREQLAPRQILVMGDSAGGGLTMTTLLRARDEDPALLPAGAILSSPFVDREIKGDDRDSPHCLITANGVEIFWKVYHSGEGEPSSWGDASPVHCDLRGLPPVYIQATELDHILPHAKRLYAKAEQDGLTNWTLEIVPNVPHAYTSLGQSAWPTAAQSLEKMSRFAAARFAHAALTSQNGNTITTKHENGTAASSG